MSPSPEKQPEKEPEKKLNEPKLKNAEEQLQNWRERTAQAVGDVDAAYDEAERKIRTPLANFEKSVTARILKLPLQQLGKEVEADILNQEGGMLKQEKVEEYGKRLNRALDAATSYINTMAKEGGLNAEALTKMVNDQNRKASKFIDLFLEHKFPDIEEAMLFAVGSRGNNSSLSEAGNKAKVTILKYLKSDFDKPDSVVMTYIWSIFSFMDKDTRISVAKDYIKGKPKDKVEAFLVKGNCMGVFDSAEIKELNPTKKYSTDEVKAQDLAWQGQNDFKMEAAKLGMIPYGTENAAGNMINIRNGLMAFVKFGAGFTVIGNFVAGAWQGGKFRGFGVAVKRLLNPQSSLAIGTYAAIKMIESDKTSDQLFHGSKPEKEASTDLRREVKNNSEWDRFFKQSDYAGSKVFFEFVRSIKGKEPDISKVSQLLTPSQFIAYLDVKIADKKPKKDSYETYDYAAIKESFEKVNPKEIYTLARAFDVLNIGAKNAKDKYELCSKEPPTTNTDKKTA